MKTPPLKQIRFFKGHFYNRSIPYVEFRLQQVDRIPTTAVPAGAGPEPGTPAHDIIFDGLPTCIRVQLGDMVEIYDPTTKRFASSSAESVVGAVPASHAAEGGNRRE